MREHLMQTSAVLQAERKFFNHAEIIHYKYPDDSLMNELFVESLFNRGFILMDFPDKRDSSRIYLQKCIDTCVRYFGIKHLTATMALNKLGIHRAMEGKFDEARDYFYQSMVIREEILDSLSSFRGFAYNNWAFINQITGQTKVAETYSKKAGEIIKKQIKLLSESERDKDIYLKLVERINPSKILPQDLKGLMVNDLPFNYAEYLKDVINNSIRQNDWMIVRAHAVNLKMHVEKYKQLRTPENMLYIDFVNESDYSNINLNNLRNQLNVNFNLSDLFYSFGIFEFKRKHFGAAAVLFDFLLKRVKTLPNYVISGQYYTSSLWLSRAYINLKEYKKARILIHEYLNELRKNYLFNIDGLKSVNSVYLFNAMFMFSELANSYWEQYNLDRNKKNLFEAYNHYLAFYDIYQEAKRRAYRYEGKEDLINQFYNIYENAIKCLIEVFHLEIDTDEIERAFLWSIDYKEHFREHFVDSQGKNILKNDSINMRIFTLESMIQSIDLQLNKCRIRLNNGCNQVYYDNLNDYLNRLKTEYDFLNMKYNTRIRSKMVKTTQSLADYQLKLCESNTSLVQYLYGDNYIFAFLVTCDTIIANIIRINNLADIVSKVRKEIIDGHKVRDISKFSEYSYQLYKKLISWIEPYVSENTQLLICPDGPLLLLPFEVLLRDIRNLKSYKDLSYFGRFYTLYYNYSPNDLLTRQNRTKKKVKYVGFAPKYHLDFNLKIKDEQDELVASKIENQRNNFSPLSFTYHEVLAVGKYMEGLTYIGPSATVDNFIKISSNADIIHCAMHAVYDDVSPDYSYLLFQDGDDSSKAEALYAFELKHMLLPSEMLVLSACNTGFGQYRRGEGLISLSETLKSAGARSLISNLWPMNDYSGANVLINFFGNLKGGWNKAVALQKAKFDYLDSCEEEHLAHPFYWAGIILQGDVQEIISPTYHYLIIGFIAALLSVVIAGFVLLKKRRKIRIAD